MRLQVINTCVVRASRCGVQASQRELWGSSRYDTVINRAEALYRALSLLAHCATMSSDGATLYKAVKEGNDAKVQRLMSSDGKKLYDAAKDGHNAKVRMWLSKGVPWDAWRTEVM